MKVEMIPINEVELDYENPRIARLVAMYKATEITSEMIAMALGAGDNQEGDTYATYRNLKESIRTNGGLIHPIIVNRTPDSKMRVIEGNTRLQIFREFHQDKTKGDWSIIPAIIHENLPRFGIDAIRLQAHLVGPRPWDPYSKARYLHLLSNEKFLTVEQIIEFCGGKRKQVMEYIQAYLDMEQQYRPELQNEDCFDPTRFSAFIELQRNKVQNALLNNGYSKKDFAKWVIDGLFHPLETVRSLPEILSDPEAKKLFFEEGAASARTVLNKINSETSDCLDKVTPIELSNELVRRLVKISHSEWKRMKESDRDPQRVALSGLLWQLQETLDGMSEESDV